MLEFILRLIAVFAIDMFLGTFGNLKQVLVGFSNRNIWQILSLLTLYTSDQIEILRGLSRPTYRQSRKLELVQS